MIADFSQISITPSDDDLRSIDMSEHWGDGAVVYAREVTPADHMKVARSCKGWPSTASFDGLIHLLTLVCQNSDGGPFFNNPIKDRKSLARMPMKVLSPLFGLLGDVSGDDSESEENLLGNLEMTRHG